MLIPIVMASVVQISQHKIISLFVSSFFLEHDIDALHIYTASLRVLCRASQQRDEGFREGASSSRRGEITFTNPNPERLVQKLPMPARIPWEVKALAPHNADSANSAARTCRSQHTTGGLSEWSSRRAWKKIVVRSSLLLLECSGNIQEP